MTRKEFLQLCGILGIGLPLQASLLSCRKDTNGSSFSGKVLIIGAGAGGLSCGYLLAQAGIDFEILEASSQYGGRMKIDTNFADFPIPLGAEWLETRTDIFEDIVNDPKVEVDIETIPDGEDRKFINYSWFNFFEEYLLPSLSGRIRYNTVVSAVDYTGEQVRVQTSNGVQTCDKVIVCVPLKILQQQLIQFTPPLPSAKQEAIAELRVWSGFKAFFEFSEAFYGESYQFTITPPTDGQKVYYDAAYGQASNRHILGLFVVGTPALDYTTRSGDALRDFILNELDTLYSGQASPNYIKHVTQNWDEEPFIQAGYLTDYADWRTVRTLGESVSDKVYFAGGAYTDGEDWVSVHAAAQSGKRAVEEVLG